MGAARASARREQAALRCGAGLLPAAARFFSRRTLTSGRSRRDAVLVRLAPAAAAVLGRWDDGGGAEAAIDSQTDCRGAGEISRGERRRWIADARRRRTAFARADQTRQLLVFVRKEPERRRRVGQGVVQGRR